MKINSTYLIIGAVAVGGFLWYRKKQKEKLMALAQQQSQEDDGGDMLGGGGGGGAFGDDGGSRTADIVPAPTSTTAVITSPTLADYSIKDPIKEAIASGSLTLSPTTTTTTTKPSTNTTITSPIKPKPQVEYQAPKETAITSKFLTFDGEYTQSNNVALDFEGNID